MGDEPQKLSATHAIERHIQTLLMTAACGLLAWNYTTTQRAQVDLAALRAQTELLRADVNKLQITMDTSTRDQYTRRQADADRLLFETKIEKLEARVRELERQ